MTRSPRTIALAAALLAAVSLFAGMPAEARLGIHPHFSGHMGGGARLGGGGAGTMRPAAGMRPGAGGSGTRQPAGGGGAGDHHGMVGWDNASRGPPRPDPNPGPGPRPDPGPHPYPVPVPVPAPAWGWDPYWDWDDEWAWGMAAGVTTGVVLGTAAAASSRPPAVGTVVEVLPGGCTATTVGDVTFEQCGSTWYRPRFEGTNVTYVVVEPPR